MSIDKISCRNNRIPYQTDTQNKLSFNGNDGYIENSTDKEKSVVAKLMIGASALAATVIGGLVIANQIKKGKITKIVEQLEQEAVQREQAYIDKTYNSVTKSAKESAEAFDTYYKNQEYVANLKKYMCQKMSVNAETIEARFNPKNSELETLNEYYRTIMGEEAAIRENAYINKINKSAKESAEVYNEYFNEIERVKGLFNNAEWLKSHNIPQGSNKALISWSEFPGRYVIAKENGVVICPHRRGFFKEKVEAYLMPVGKKELEPFSESTFNIVTINGKKYLAILDDQLHGGLNKFLNRYPLSPQTGFDEWVNFTKKYGYKNHNIIEEFINLEKKDNKNMYEQKCINEFKEKWENLLPTLKLNEKDKIVYVPQISGEGQVYIQKADGSVIKHNNGKLLRLKPVKGETNGCYTEIINGKKYAEVANYKPTKNGVIKTYYGKNPRTIEVDKKLGEFSIEKDGYQYYYSINNHELLDVRQARAIGTDGKAAKLESYNPPKGGKSGDDSPEIILIKLRGGGTAKLYKMPNGKILTSKEFHFPGSAKQEKDFQNYLKQLHELAEHQRALERQREIEAELHRRYMHNKKKKEKAVIKYR